MHFKMFFCRPVVLFGANLCET